MGDADQLLFLTKGDDAMPVLKPNRPRGPEGDAAQAMSLSKKMRLPASIVRFGMNLRLRCHLCGILIPHGNLNRDRETRRLGRIAHVRRERSNPYRCQAAVAVRSDVERNKSLPFAFR